MERNTDEPRSRPHPAHARCRDRDVRRQPAAHGRRRAARDGRDALHRRHYHERSAGRFCRFIDHPDRRALRHRRRPRADRRGATARRLARRQGRQQREPSAGPADGGRGRPRVPDELDRRRRHLHPGGAAHLAKSRHVAKPADDAAEFRRADQRHADTGGNGAQPGRERRTDPTGCAGIQFFQLYPVRAAAARTGYHLYAVRARPALQQEPARRRGPPPHACALDRAIRPRRSRKARPHRRRLSARRQAPRPTAAPLRRREPSCHRARDGVCGQGAPSNRADGTAGRRCAARRCAHLERRRQRAVAVPEASSRGRSARSEITFPTARRRSAPRRSSCRPNPR